MIRRVMFFVALLALGTPSYGQVVHGAWRECSLKWIKAPADYEQTLRTAPATTLYFGPDHVFVMVVGTVWERDQSEGLGADIAEIYFGKWSQNGAILHLEYRLIDRTIAVMSNKVPGPIETTTVVLERNFIVFKKRRFQRDAGLDSDLQKETKAIQGGFHPRGEGAE